MKKVLVISVLFVLVVSVVFAFYLLGDQKPQNRALVTTTPTPYGTALATPTPANETETLIAQIQEQLVAEHGESAKSLDVTVSIISGNFAQGAASEVGFGGGMWFAAKVAGKWELVWDGNGMITCDDLTNYPDFPSSLIPACYDKASEEMKDR